MTIWISLKASLFTFERLDISWASHIHPSQKLWPFEFVESFIQFRPSRYIIRMNWTFEWNLITNRISRDLSLSILERVYISWASHKHLSKKLWPFEFAESFRVKFQAPDILCAWIGDSSKMFWPFEFVKSLRWSFSSVSVYHGPHTYTRVISYGHLNLSRAFMFNFDRLDILCAWIGHPSEILLPFKFLESLRCSVSSFSIYQGPHTYTRVKS